MLNKPDLQKIAWKILPQWKESIIENKCPECKKDIQESEFESELGKLEYSISGLCETCQKLYFR